MAAHGRDGSNEGPPPDAGGAAPSADDSLALPPSLGPGDSSNGLAPTLPPARSFESGQATLPNGDDSEVEPRAGVGRPYAPSEAPPAAENERYEVLEPLGRGGMGDVYRARDRRLGREVALKFLRHGDADRTLRLLQEARAQARVEHPNVCKVHEVGEIDGKAYIAMQLVAGQPLDRAVASMSLPEKVRVMQIVAEAVHEAHRLGVVHRDLKPSNVMVGRGPDGRWSPVVMDFGLAYEIARGHGLTETGTLLGTPAYMPPEQARGDVRGVDQRSDVYSLGATLYDVLAGVPPFTAATSMGLLAKVLHDEPKPLRAHVPDLPADLETITLKCLSKDPDRRYPSARALADDLGRYLAGEPVSGRLPGALERLGRWARAHRPFMTTLALSLAAASSLSALGVRSWLEARRVAAQAATQVRLAGELGQEANEIEGFLRSAYELPLHDTSAERQRARERLGRIAALAAATDGAGGGVVHYALGRGHLALGEFAAARDAFARARRAGYESPELYYALGRALGELYRRALDDARRGGGVAWVAERRRAIEAEFLAPALEAFEKGRGVKLESPPYLEGLIAFYRGDYDEAERAVRQAAAETPWLYDAKRLAGDVAYARALDRLERGAYDEARAGLEAAAGLYERATAVGRSDARAYEALAEAWLQRSEVDLRQGRPRGEALAAALAAADGAVVASPLSASTHTRRARVLMQRYWSAKFQGDGADPKPVLDAWLETAGRAVALDPDDVYAHDALGVGHYQRALGAASEGKDPGPAFDEAAAWLTRALKRQPNYPWALNDLAQVYRWQGSYLAEHGLDPSAAFAAAERHFVRAIGSDPRYLFAHANLGDLYVDLAAHDLSRGRDPGGAVGRALEVGEQSLSIDQRYYLVRNQMARAELARAEFLSARGDDPGPAAARAFDHLDRSLAINPSLGRTSLYRAQGQCLLARHALRTGGDPGAALEAGRAALDEADRRDRGCVDCRVTGARLGLVEAEWARQKARPFAPIARRALGEAKQAVLAYPHLEAHLEAARADRLLAEAEASRAALDDGDAQIERALRLAPNSADAHAVRGGLWLARAGAAGDAAKRAELARRARDAIAQAFALNPLLRVDYEAALREAEAQSVGATARR
jgi:eukaryotic-like serine/threonine-protein kinase